MSVVSAVPASMSSSGNPDEEPHTTLLPLMSAGSGPMQNHTMLNTAPTSWYTVIACTGRRR